MNIIFGKRLEYHRHYHPLVYEIYFEASNLVFVAVSVMSFFVFKKTQRYLHEKQSLETL